MSKVLLSIKPEFASKIFNKEKFFEFRKTIFKKTDVSKVIVYASSPEKCVIGEFTVDLIIPGTPENVWKETKDGAGITRDFFNSYFKDRNVAYAIKIKEVKRYKKVKYLSEYGLSFAPQSFVYIKD